MSRSILLATGTLTVATAGAIAFLVHANELALSIDDFQAPGFSAQSLSARLSGAALRQFALEVDRLVVAGRVWRKVKLDCPDLQVAGTLIACSRGVLDLGGKIPISFSYASDRRNLAVELKPAADETWRIAGLLGGAQQTDLQLTIDRGRLERLTSWLPNGAPKISGGRVSGTVQLQTALVSARLEVDGLAFSDASGLHAGEKISATLDGDIARQGDDWRWSARLEWRGGGVFWQPLFVAGNGQRLRLEGAMAGGMTDVRTGDLELPGIGSVAFTARWNHASGGLEGLEARGSRLRVAPLYENLLKPLLQQTVLADLRAEGHATIALQAAGNTLTSVDVEVNEVSLEDRQQRRFALFGVTGRVPWRRDEATAGEVTIKGAEFLKLPVGTVRMPLRMRGASVAIDSVRVPILDGALQFRDFAARTTDDGWRWRFSGEVEPISMSQLTQTLGMPIMHGSLSGVIPEVRYRRRTLAMDGSLLIAVFDGTARATRLELIEPFGRAPRLHADIEMKQLDLELLTRTFDFGTITGRIDAHVRGLELVNWQPVRFEARVESSPGSYPKRISQTAVQNISALGGAGAAAAIQRSFLRFFEQFGYQKIGLSCRLENGVCEMDGVERAPRGYVIVKGGGIPAITVIGYNRHVSWGELVDRLKRITQENVKPIVK